MFRVQKIIFTISKSAFTAKVPNNGKSKKVVAVLLVNSVKKQVRKVKNKIRRKILNSFKKLIFFEISFASPVSITKEAIAKPPPKRIKTFHGIFLNQLAFKIVSFF